MNRTIIIAEAGVNHNGDVERALTMIDQAARAGVDYVKFQTFNADKLVTAAAPTAEYQQRNTAESSQLAMLRRLQLDKSDYQRLIDRCRERGVGFMSTPFDSESIEFLATLGMDYWKIPSGEITNKPYLRQIASKGGKIIMSTGMSTLEEVGEALEVLTQGGVRGEDIILLHCTTQYPTPYTDVNLKAMSSLKQFPVRGVGYSDHTRGITVPVAAVALGAMVVEKHFTLDRNLPGPDHKASLEPDELVEMVRQIRIVEESLGSEEKIVTAVESPNRAVARKSIVAARYIGAGELFTSDNLTVKRPGTGISPMRWDEVVGSRAMRDYSPDEQIDL